MRIDRSQVFTAVFICLVAFASTSYAHAATFTIGGTVTGLTSGASVTLLDNGAGALKVAANGKFTFAKALATGAAYKVTVSVQPTGETCTVTAGSGTVGSANVTTVKVACKAATTTHTIGGTVSGLTSGNSVTLLDNGSGPLKVTANGAFTFAKALASGATYSVTVSVQPTGETCTVTAGSGTVGSANVTTVKVACKATTTTHTIGGTVSGLTSGASVTLLDNGSGALKVSANGAFTFATALASGATYNVTVSVQPTGETCTVTGGSGTVGSANVTTVKVACATAATHTIGGTVSGLNSGTSVTLLDNGADSLKVTANGAFTFATAVASGATYSVTVSVPPTGETCTVTGGSGTVGSANVTTVKVACSAGTTGGSGAYWIPYSATPAPGATPAGSNGVFLIPSDKLSSSPAPTWVTTDNTQLLGIGTQLSVKSGVVTYSPQVMMYADTTSAGTTKIFGLTLAGTATVPTPVQISNLSLSKTQVVCQIGSSSETDITDPTTLFAVIQVGTATQCNSGTGTFEVVHYLDSATTAPVVVSINSATFDSIYQNGKLTALLQLNSATNTLIAFADDTFKTPTQKITGVTSANNISSVLDEATLSTSGLFYSVTTTGGANELYRVDGSSISATLIQNIMTGSISGIAQDDNNLYYLVTTPGASGTVTATFNQVALSGGTPQLLYTAPALSNAAGIAGYQLIGSNDSALAFYFHLEPLTNGSPDPTKATATIYTVPIGKTSTTPTTLANYPAGNTVLNPFLASPSGAGLSSSVLFTTVRNTSGSISTPTIAYSAASLHMNGSASPSPIANSVYLPLAFVSVRLSDNVWQIKDITDTDGGYGGGTANLVNVSNLTDTPFTTTGGGDYVIPAGFDGALEAISSNNIAVGFFENSSDVEAGKTTTLLITSAAADLTKDFFLPIALKNTYVAPY